MLVEHCRLYSTCNALKFGTDSQGDFRDVLVRHVEVGGPSDDMRAIKRRKADGGISWETVDGGTVERVLVTTPASCAPRARCSCAWATAGACGRNRRARDRAGCAASCSTASAAATTAGAARSSPGVPGHVIEDVLLRDVDLPMAAADAPAVRQQDIPEAPADYPDPHMFAP